MAEQATQQQTELDSRVVDIRRTTKVVQGGRDFSFSATAVVGDGQGTVGYGRGKSKEVSVAIQKATESAKKNMQKINLKGDTLQHPITVSEGGTKIVMKPAAQGSGIIAGGAVRDVFEVLGISNVSAKTIGSSNPMNVVRTVINGLLGMYTPEYVAQKRGKSIDEILG